MMKNKVSTPSQSAGQLDILANSFFKFFIHVLRPTFCRFTTEYHSLRATNYL